MIMCSPRENNEAWGAQTGPKQESKELRPFRLAGEEAPAKGQGIGEAVAASVKATIPQKKVDPGYQGVGATLGTSPLGHRTTGRSSRGAGLNPRRQSAKGKTVLTGSLA